MAAKQQRTYEDMEPPVERSEEDGCIILAIYIPGFSKEQIRVQVSSTRVLRISGERAYKNTNKAWQRFHKEFQIPLNCNTSNITAKYKGGILHVRQPLRRPVEEPQQLPPPPPPPPPPRETSHNNNINNNVEEGANMIKNNEITSRAGAARRLKLILLILVVMSVSVLCVLIRKRLSPTPTPTPTPTMVVGLEQPTQ